MEIRLPPPLPGLWPRFSSLLKLASICFLIVLLHVPLLMTRGVLRERQEYQAQATQEISGVWGRRQTVSGPVLAVPYVYRQNVIRPKAVEGKVVQVEETEEVPAVAYFLPESLAIAGTVDPEIRSRGIYDAVVYSTRLAIAGNFQPDFAAAGIKADRVNWEQAQLHFGISDLRGIRTVSPVTLNAGRSFAFEPAGTPALEGLSLGAAIEGAAAGARLDFALDATLQGSERLDLVPLGKTTTVELRSPWPAPAFDGANLPVQRSVTPEGFTARWETSHLSRGFGQSWSSRNADLKELAKKLESASFGVGFVQPVDGYRLAERAQKYGVLFFVLVFAVFFLFEVTGSVRIHALQYAIVGAALCLFFLAFLALSEFLATPVAYGVAAGACTLLVSLYAWSFLRTGGRSLVIAGGLGGTYAYLYFVLKSQDYALVAGTAALFAGLALVMFFTRRLNWDRVGEPEPAREGA